MRKLLAMLAVAAMSMSLMVAPALADRPITFTDTANFVAVNPCTGEPHEVSLYGEFRLHEHRNNFLFHVDRSGSTSDGYEIIAGTEIFNANKGGDRGGFVDQWRHPDGSKFMVHGSFAYNANQNELKFENFSITCIGNG